MSEKDNRFEKAVEAEPDAEATAPSAPRAAGVSAPAGKVSIRYREDHYSQDWGAPEKHQKGQRMEVDAETAKEKIAAYGGEACCPFEIVAKNKGLAGAPSTK